MPERKSKIIATLTLQDLNGLHCLARIGAFEVAVFHQSDWSGTSSLYVIVLRDDYCRFVEI
jgi:hypothetical protein